MQVLAQTSDSGVQAEASILGFVDFNPGLGPDIDPQHLRNLNLY